MAKEKPVAKITTKQVWSKTKKDVGSATVSFRIPENIAAFLNEQADERKDGSSKPSHHKEARRIFAYGLKELYGIELA